METLLTNKTVSMTELRDPAKVLANAGDTPVAVLNRSKVVGYFVPNTAVDQLQIEVADIAHVRKLLKASREEVQPVLDYLKDK